MANTEKKWMYVSFALMGIIALTAIIPEAEATAKKTLKQAFEMIANLQNQIDGNNALDRAQQAEINQLERDVQNIGQPGATIYKITETQIVSGSPLVTVSCNPGDAAIGGTLGPNASVQPNNAHDFNNVFEAEIVLRGDEDPQPLEITAICAHFPTDE